jgi:hypothetical protein
MRLCTLSIVVPGIQRCSITVACETQSNTPSTVLEVPASVSVAIIPLVTLTVFPSNWAPALGTMQKKAITQSAAEILCLKCCRSGRCYGDLVDTFAMFAVRNGFPIIRERIL